MSEIRINIIDNSQTVSGTMHGSFGDVLVAALTAEPETVGELEIAVQRFVERESDWSVFRSFRNGENFEPYDAGLLVIDLAAKVILADSTYSYYSTDGTVRRWSMIVLNFHFTKLLKNGKPNKKDTKNLTASLTKENMIIRVSPISPITTK